MRSRSHSSILEREHFVHWYPEKKEAHEVLVHGRRLLTREAKALEQRPSTVVARGFEPCCSTSFERVPRELLLAGCAAVAAAAKSPPSLQVAAVKLHEHVVAAACDHLPGDHGLGGHEGWAADGPQTAVAAIHRR